MARVLLAEALDAAAERRLEAAATVVRPPDSGADALLAAIAGCDALVARTSTRVTRALLRAGAPSLRVVGIAGVGTDNVDEAAAGEMGIAVLNAAAAASDAVAEFTVALALTWLRPVGQLAARLRSGEFSAARERPHGRELRELTVGIIGMGRIGSRVGRICAAGFGSRVLYHDIAAVGPFDFARPASLDELLASADVISLHVPLTARSRGMINAAALERVKPGALLVNTARGAVVETDALVEALRSARLGGAALDVTLPEPLPPDHALLHMSNVIVTPHVAARTAGGLQRMSGIVDDVIRFLRPQNA